jgi:transcription elongation factor Elf1
MAVTCAWCGIHVQVAATGPIPRWCGSSCRHRAWEQRRSLRLALGPVDESSLCPNCDGTDVVIWIADRERELIGWECRGCGAIWWMRRGRLENLDLL